jgi:transposase
MFKMCIILDQRNFLKQVKKHISGDMAREATSDKVKRLRSKATVLKETSAELLMENRLLEKA